METTAGAAVRPPLRRLPRRPPPAPTTSEAATPSPTAASNPTVSVSDHPGLGDILAGQDGLALYMFDSDANGEAASTCYDSCADAWPPLVVEGDAVTAELATFERDGGDAQAAAAGWPLYYFASEKNPATRRDRASTTSGGRSGPTARPSSRTRPRRRRAMATDRPPRRTFVYDRGPIPAVI